MRATRTNKTRSARRTNNRNGDYQVARLTSNLLQPIALLVEACLGADVTDHRGNTPLQFVSQEGHTNTIRSFVDAVNNSMRDKRAQKWEVRGVERLAFRSRDNFEYAADRGQLDPVCDICLAHCLQPTAAGGILYSPGDCLASERGYGVHPSISRALMQDTPANLHASGFQRQGATHVCSKLWSWKTDNNVVELSNVNTFGVSTCWVALIPMPTCTSFLLAFWFMNPPTQRTNWAKERPYKK